MIKQIVLFALLAVLCFISTSPVLCRVPNLKRTLVVIDSQDVRNSHSRFFAQLQSKGHHLDYYLAAQAHAIKFSQFGEYNYDHLIIMAPKASSLGPLSTQAIDKFVDDGNNVMIVADGALSKLLRDVGAESGVQFDDDSTRAIDHFSYDLKLDNGKHNVLVLNQEYEFSPRPSVISNRRQFTQNPVLYNGLAISLKRSNPLLLPILTGSGTSYSHSGSEAIQTKPLVRGRKTVLVGGLQARNGARITFVGSKDLLSDKYFEASVTQSSSSASKPSGNAAFAQELIQWSFQERGVLRHRQVFHYNKQGDHTVQPSEYRVGDEIVYTVIVEEWVGDKWVPFVADDIQVELIMLHPYVRTVLKHVGNGKYEADIRAPDVYGCFKFKVDYRRTGYASLIFEDAITIRPTRINEFERFIPAAYPYYISVFSSMAGFLVFVVVFLFTGDKVKRD